MALSLLCRRAHETGHWMSSVYDLSLVLSKEFPSPLAGSFPATYLLSALQQVKCICLRAFTSAASSGPRCQDLSTPGGLSANIISSARPASSIQDVLKKDHRLERSHFVGNLKTYNSSVNEKLNLVNILVSSLL